MKPENHQIPSIDPSAIRRVRKSRTLLAFLLLTLILLPLTSCALPRQNAATVREPVQETPVGLPDNLVCEITTESVSDATRSSNGTILAAYSYQIPVMGIYRRNGEPLTEESAVTERELFAVKMADTFNQAFAQWQNEADFPALEELAWQDYDLSLQEGSDWVNHYEQGLDTDVYQTDRLVSVSGRFYYYAGGAHPNTVLLGWNYDLEKGAFFYAGQLFQETEAVTEALLRMANARAAEWNMDPREFYWEDYEQILGAWSDSSAVVTFDDDNMTVSFSPYDIAAYAAGEQIFDLPRTWIEPYLNQYGKRLLSVSD